MGQKTEIITYNLKERGRTFVGKERNFSGDKIAALCAYINGPKMQEKVKNRDLLGYRGHWPRIAFGMTPTEGGIAKGVIQHLEPAIVTTYLKAYPDGTVEHQSEFLDTVPGQVAERMHRSRVGGFSSAIDGIKNEFCGFDYVNEPNYTTNRGYMLDSAGMLFDDAGDSLTLDDVCGEIERENSQGVLLLLDSAMAAVSACEQLAETVEYLRAENADLIAQLAKAGTPAGVFDSAGFELPRSFGGKGGVRMLQDVADFRGAALPVLAPLPSNDEAQRRDYDKIAGRFGIGR